MRVTSFTVNVRERARIEVPTHKDLLAAWRLYRDPIDSFLVDRFIVRKSLTAAQLRRLPKALRDRVEYAGDAAVAWLEELYELEDPRGAGKEKPSAGS
ncbi:MAG: hypothetical protein WB524_20195 [Acidobacteriaceae bacterium]